MIDLEIGLQQRFIELRKPVSSLHDVTVRNSDLRDDAAVEMLHGLRFAFDGNAAGGDDGTRDLGQRHPAAEPTKQGREREQPKTKRPLEPCFWHARLSGLPRSRRPGARAGTTGGRQRPCRLPLSGCSITGCGHLHISTGRHGTSPHDRRTPAQFLGSP